LEGQARADTGQIELDGKQWSPMHEKWTAVVHQEAQLFPNLTVAQNLLVGRERTRFRRPRLSKQDRALLDDLGLGSYRHVLLVDCPLAIRQRVEIARALAADARIFLFDEPNSALTAAESTQLFRAIRELADAGHVVGLVSHRLPELAQVCDRVAVLLDGEVSTILEGDRLTEVQIARELVASEEALLKVQRVHRSPESERKTLLSLRKWCSRRGRFSDIDLEVSAGSVIAVFGVEGSGGRDLLRSLAGVEPARGFFGLQVDGLVSDSRSIVEYVPADRSLSLFPHLTVAQNIVSRLGRPVIAGRVGRIRRREIERVAKQFIARMTIRCRSPWQPITDLSGGNQQKVAIAAALARNPVLLVLEEPTRGVDIQSKAEIHALLRDFAAAGRAAVLFCTEIPEVYEVATQVCVIHDGQLSQVLAVSDFPDVASLASAVAAEGGE
jgi:ABC-type sugar transport system ATPase subunit